MDEAVIPEFLTVRETAELLRVDRQTVYVWIASGQLPGAYRFGRAWRIRRQALLEAQASLPIPSQENAGDGTA